MRACVAADELRCEVLAPQERVEDVRDRRVAARARFERGLHDSVAREPRRQHPRQRAERRTRSAEHARHLLLGETLRVVRVAAEDLVGTFAGQHDRDLAPRELGEQHRRQRRLVAERLVEYIDPPRERRQHLVGREHEAVVAAADVASDARRLLVLAADVVAAKAEVERVECAAGDARGERCDDARVDASAHERAERHVGDQHRLDRACEPGVELLERGRLRQFVLGHVRRSPELAGREPAVAYRQPVSGRQLADVAVDRERRRNVLALEIERERVEVECVREPRKWSQRLQLRAEGERALVPGVVERLDAQVIAREEDLAAAAVPQSEREHAGDALEEPRPPRLPAVDQDLAVALRGKEMPRVGELAPQRAEIVDLAVEHDGDRAVGRHERLLAARESITDSRRKPRPAGPSKWRPSSSGPRCASAAVIAGSASRARGSSQR